MIETVLFIGGLLLVAGLICAALYMADEIRSLRRELKGETDYRRELQSRVYELHGELRGGFQQLGLRWKQKEDAGWTKE